MFPKEFLDAVEKATRANLDDLDVATDEAMAVVTKLPGYKKLIDDMARRTIRSMAADIRHKINCNLGRKAQAFVHDKKVPIASREAVWANERFYNFCIAGRTLGNVVYEELDDLIAAERGYANGHLRNLAVLERLKEVGKPGKRVRDFLSDDALGELFAEVQEAA